MDAGAASAYYGYGYGGTRASGGPHLSHEARADAAAVSFFQSNWSSAIERGIHAVQTWRPDVVHLHTAMLWYVAQAIQTSTKTPIVYHVHSVDRAEYEIGHEPNPWLAHSYAQDQAIAASDRLIALTWSEADLLIRYYPAMQAKIRVVGNGIDDSATARAAAFRSRLPGSPLVLYSGRLVERKGIRELLDAIPQVLDTTPNAYFVLAGGPPPLTGDEVAAQWLRPEHTAYRDRIHFTGWLSPKDVYRWYAAADILVVPSRYEPFGMVVLEGMLHGLPVIAAEVGGPADIIQQGRTGLLIPPRDVAALAAALRQLVENDEDRHRMGRAAAEEVRLKWLWERLVPDMLEVYREFQPVPPHEPASLRRTETADNLMLAL